MEKPHILGTGLQGLIGKQISELLSDTYNFVNISRSSGVDIANKEQVTTAISNSDAEYVLHLAAKTDVDGCEHDKQAGEQGEAWKINVTGTANIVEACKASDKTILYISTDMVFDGKKGDYSEEDDASPVNWYGRTKYEAEKVVQHSGISYLILRPAYPYGKPHETRKNFIDAILARLRSGQEVAALTDHIFTPTYIPDIAMAIQALIASTRRNEIFHIVGSQFITPYDIAHMLAEKYGLNKQLIKPTTRAEFFAGRAERPYNLSMKNDKITELGVRMSTFAEGISKLKVQS